MEVKQIMPRKPLLAAMGAIALVGSLVTGANAAVWSGGYTKDGVQIRTGASSATTLVARADLYDGVCLYFTTTGESNGGSTTWWWTKNTSKNKSGYSPGSKLYIIGPVSSC